MHKLLPSPDAIRDNAWYDLLKWAVISLVALLAALGWATYRYDLGPLVFWATLLSVGWISIAVGFVSHLRRSLVASTAELSNSASRHSQEIERQLGQLHTGYVTTVEELARLSRLLTPSPTSDGMNWHLCGQQVKNGKADAVLRIWSVGELPQPLELEVECTSHIEAARPKFFLDASRLNWDNSNLEIGPLGSATITIRLGSPKLHPPAFFEVILVSADDTEVQVLRVRHAVEPKTHA